jgi:hypothetical protein
MYVLYDVWLGCGEKVASIAICKVHGEEVVRDLGAVDET